MGSYRVSRDIEASLIDYLTTNFSADWSGVNVEKSYARVYGIDLPTVCIRVNNTSHDRAEIGGNSTIRTVQGLIDIFASDDGQKLDLTDYVVEKIKNGCPFYEHTVSGGAVTSTSQNGRIRILSIDVTPIDFDTDKDKLDVHDRHRTLITLTISLGRIEV